MRRWQLALVSAVLVIAGFFPISEASAAPTDPAHLPNLLSCPTMRVGNRGPCVEALQYSLKIAGLNVQQDGAFGPQTRGAVIAFQSQHGLVKDGIAGPNTKAALDRVANAPEPSRSFRGCPQFSVGVRHACVDRFWYEFTGIPGNPDAYRPNSTTYTQEMANAVRSYQSRNGLVVDGVVGRQTADLVDVQAGPTRVCLAMGGDSLNHDGTCPGAGAVGMGKSVWDCFQESMIGAPFHLLVEHYKDEWERGNLIPKSRVLGFLIKWKAPAEAFKCVSFG